VSERWTSGKLYVGRRAEETKNKAKRAIAALGRRKPFLIVYYGSDYAGGWQSVDAPLRTVTTLDRFGLVTWDGNTPLLRMLQPPELLDAMGASGHKLPETSRRNQVKLCGNGICSPVIEKIVRTISKVEEKSQSEQLGAIS
jgi:DNA (cytosine-5)-methyltransferase 1